MALALSFTAALVILAQPISALTLIVEATNNSDDVLDSSASSSGGNGRKCPDCGYPMKLCLPPSEYKWICHNCGCYVLR